MTPDERARKAASGRAYQDRNRERLQAYGRARYLRERERRRMADRERRLTDPDFVRRSAERARRWRLAHPERSRAHRRAWLDEVPIREAAVRCAATANSRARMYGVDGQIGYETVLELWRREPVCVDCGEGRGLDHVIPLSRGGSNTSGNLANRCRSCNSRKGKRLPEEIAA
jgi:5-methylcytosine-specific restriction endonuclease McrA